MARRVGVWLGVLVLSATCAWASIFGTVQGVVHDAQHRPIEGASVEIRAVHSDLVLKAESDASGKFSVPSVPLGDYRVVVSKAGFETQERVYTLASDTSPVLHFEMQVGRVQQRVSVDGVVTTANVNSVTPTTLVDREDIAQTPGADRTNSLAMITDFTPGAYVTHDMLHMRGGHQLDWQIDGVEIPNTNIGSNLAAQIDPKDIDYIEVQRGSYTADVGDRTYGVFNVVPRSGFERNREAELVINAGNFNQTNDQLNFGDHTEKFAYYGSLNGNRSDYGLAPPIAQVYHDADNGYGGFASLIYNRTPKDQLRLIAMEREDYFQVPYDPSSTDFEALQYNSSGLRDGQHETDIADAFSYLHSFTTTTVLQLSPFYHYNAVDYASSPEDTPVSTTYKRASNYAGGQIAFNTVVARNSIEGGVYSFGQHDKDLFGAVFNPPGGPTPNFLTPGSESAGLVESYVSDNYKPFAWLTLIAGVRQSHFQTTFAENYIYPRFGVAVRVPKIGWVFRAFYGHFYQPPPLLTVQCGTSTTASATPTNCAVESYAVSSGTSFATLHGERDEEHQFGVQIPLPGPARGWLLDVDNFKTRAVNFLDHSNVGNSSIYFPITDQGALVRAWELTLRSPRVWKFGQAHVAYSNQIAEQLGAITGGLICQGPSAAVGDPCYIAPGYTPLDHDQRDTLNVGFRATLPWQSYASMNYYFGSGFHNGDPDPATPYPNQYLPYNTSVDVAVGKTFNSKLSGSMTVTNVQDRRTLLDNSLTFGGFHYNDPRQFFAEVRYRFKY
ncbi:MAG: TonB-dependent receptor [Acidobacteria bacterium]|nr:TonB-dependent receptor [Acidobacteriota bacterium]